MREYGRSNSVIARLLGTTALSAMVAMSPFVWEVEARAQDREIPTGANVVSGSASVHSRGKKHLHVRQSSDSAIITWKSFSVGGKASAHFENGSGATLNRVTGNAPSGIHGSLSATGSLYLVNPAGVVIGPGGQVSTGGSFVASTHDVTDAEFLEGRSMIFSGTSDAEIVNRGTITSAHGDVALIARRVENSGSISAPNGTAALAAGYEVLMRDHAHGDGMFSVRIGGEDTEALNSGAIAAAEVELRANGGNVYALAGSTDDVIKATGVAKADGRIFLTAGDEGTVTTTQEITASRQVAEAPDAPPLPRRRPEQGGDIRISGGAVTINGKVDASGSGGEGGSIVATAETLSLGPTARLDAGGTSGGTILLGGDFKGGSDPQAKLLAEEVSTAQTLGVAEGATIAADATAGDGGDIVMWSDRFTAFAGHISARGAGQGDGGFAEVSGRAKLAFTGSVDLTAASGATGSLLLDPYNVTIADAAGSGTDDSFTATGEDSVISVTTLEGALAEANVTVSTGAGGGQEGDITVAAPIAWSDTTLTLDAARSIIVNAEMTATGTGGLALHTNQAGNGGGYFVNAPINLPATGSFSTKHHQDAAIDYTIITRLGAEGSTSGTDLQGIAGDLDGNFVLGADIDAAATESWNGGFDPLGDGTERFTGTFDGLGHEVADLTIKRPGENHVGLFGRSDGTLRNIRILGGSISGDFYVGGLVGWNDGGVIKNAYATGEVSGNDYVGGLVGLNDNSGTIENAYATGDVSGNDYVGGLVGLNLSSGTITNAYATGKVPGTGNRVGALVGNNWGTITNAYATGDVSGNDDVGGLVGQNNGTIRNAYTTGDVTGNRAVGGLIGRNFSGAIGDSYAIGKVAGANDVGGLVGHSTGGFIFNSYATGDVTGTDRVGGLVGFNEGVLILHSHAAGDVTGTDHVGGLVGYNDSGTIEDAYATGDVTGSWLVGGLVGRNDSGTIEDAYATGDVTGTDHVGGLVGHNFSGTIENAFATGNVSGTKDSGNDYVGGLVGENSGTITNTYATGDVTGSGLVGGLVGVNHDSIAASYATGKVAGNEDRIGGLVGENSGPITNAYATGDVTGSRYVGGLVAHNYGANGTIENSYATGKVAGANNVGGLVGLNSGTIENAYATGDVSGNDYVGGLVGLNLSSGTITNAYATGDVSGNDDVGALVGNNVGTITNGYWNTDISGPGVGVGAGNDPTKGKTTAELSGALPDGFDSAVWDNVGNQTTPFLRDLPGPFLIGSDSDTLFHPISDVDELQAINADLARNYALINDIDASATLDWNGGLGFDPLGDNTISFTGTFDGLGHEVADLTIERPGEVYVGLFGRSDGTLRNVGIVGGAISGGNYVGGLVGDNWGPIKNAYATGDVTGRWLVGGLVGVNHDSITTSFATGKVAGNHDGVQRIGGLVGENSGPITNAYATGDVTGSIAVGGLVANNWGANGTIENSYATGKVTGNSFAGGLVGRNDGGTVINGYWNSDVNDPDLGGVGTGLTTAEFQDTAGFMARAEAEGWDFETVWAPPSDGFYPELYALSAVARVELQDSGTIVYGETTPNAEIDRVFGGPGSYVFGPDGDALDQPTLDQLSDDLDAGDYAISGPANGTSSQGQDYRFVYTNNLLHVDRRAITITADDQSRTYGDDNLALTYSVDGLVNDDSLFGSLTTDADATSNVGAYSIDQGTLTASGNYDIQSYTAGTLAVTPRALTVTPDAVDRIYGEANPASGSASGDNLVNNDSIDAVDLASAADATSNVGAYDLTGSNASGEGLGNYDITYAVNSGGLSVTPRALTVTPDAVSRVYGDANPASGKATGDNLVNNDSIDAVDLASAADATSNVGAYDLTGSNASGSGLGNYAITYAVNSGGLTVTPRALTVTPDAVDRIYGNTNPASGKATGDNLVNNDSIDAVDLASAADATSNVGAYDLEGSNASGSGLGNYDITYQVNSGGLTVTPRALTVTPDAIDRVYGEANPASGAASADNLVNNDSIDAVDLASTADATSDVGAYDLEGSNASGSGLGNYDITYQVNSGGLTVTPRALTVTPDAIDRIYGEANPASGKATGDNLVNNDSIDAVDLASAADATSNVGAYDLEGSNASGEGLGNYDITYDVNSGGLTVTARPIAIAADDQSRTYGDDNPVLTYTIGGRGLVNGDSLSGNLATDADATSDVGGYDIDRGTLAASGNYDIQSYTAGTLDITRRALTVTPDAIDRVYGEANPASGAASADNLVNNDSIDAVDLASTADATSDVGAYDLEGSNASGSGLGNYDITYQVNSGGLTVTPRALTVTPDGVDRIYGNANPASGSASANDLVNGDSIDAVDLASAADVTSNVGAYDLEGSNASGSGLGNYDITYQVNSGGLTVTPRALTVTPDAVSRVYGDANPASGKATGDNLVNNDSIDAVDLASAADATSNVGAYDLEGSNASGSGLGNYDITYQANSGGLTVTPRALTVTPDGVDRIYGDANPASGAATGDNLVNNDSIDAVELASAADATSNVGAYDLEGSNASGEGLDNYAITYQVNSGGLSVTARPITITADDKTRSYGDDNPALTYDVGGRGLVNGDSLSGSLTTDAEATSNVGAYGIDQGTLAASGNYEIESYTAGSLAVTPRALTVTPNGVSRIYGDANPASGSATGDNLVNNDSIDAVDLASAADATSNVGAYDLEGSNASGSGLGNYDITYDVNSGGLTVTPRALTVTPDGVDRIYGNANPASGKATGDNLVNNDSIDAVELASAADATSNVGDYDLTGSNASGSGLGNYDITYDVNSGGLSVTPRALTVTPDAVDRIYGEANPASGKATGNNLVNNDSIDAVDLASAADATSNVGAYDLEGSNASGSGLGNYDITYQVNSGGLTVTPRALTVTPDAIDRVYGEANPASGSASGDNLVNNDSIDAVDLASAADVTSNVGDYDLEGSNASGSGLGNYAITYDVNSGGLSVTPRALTVTPDAIDRIYGEANPASGSASGDNLVNNDSIDAVDLASAADATSNVGAYDLEGSNASGSGLGNYAITYAVNSGGLTVTPRALTVTPDAVDRIYGNANPASGSASGDNLVNNDSIDAVELASAADATSNVGAYDLTGSNASGEGLGNYDITYAVNSGGLSVTPRALTVTPDAIDRIYGEANPASGAATGDNLVNNDSIDAVELASAADATSDVGAYDLEGSNASGEGLDNYAITYAVNSNGLTVTPRALTVTPDAIDRIYGEANPASGSASGDNLVNNDSIDAVDLASTADATSNVGAYDLEGSNASGSGLGNYAITYQVNSNGLSVTARPITITADDKSRGYGDNNPTLTYTVDGRGLVNGDSLSGSLATDANATSNVGHYSIDQGTLAASGNYDIESYTAGTLAVTPRALTVTPHGISRVYGDDNPASGSASGDNLVNGDSIDAVDLISAADASSNVGSYDLQGSNASGEGLGNYAITYQVHSNGLSVTARPITITADDQTRSYGDDNPALTYAVGGRGLVNGDSLSGSLATDANATSNVGHYSIDQGTLAASGNYDIESYTAGTLAVTPRALTVRGDDADTRQGEPVPPLTASVTDGSLAPFHASLDEALDDFAVSTLATQASPVGTYAIDVAGRNANYDLTLLPGTLSIAAGTPTLSDTNGFPPFPMERTLFDGPWSLFFLLRDGVTTLGLSGPQDSGDLPSACLGGVGGQGCAGFPYFTNTQFGQWLSFNAN
ncbi:MBG domain-containing protein [Aquibaculum arenosum]|uniref:MBG domain-containing protein n=1 Tax=Aquibaculum arenosum TaxID=3032591 RepID=A0ABT5YRF3_9PROT|nr:MBG domain-containing protein [Fodinicurvata sp. CAU 1616]MDF2097469.1 MBG domain-containing protein [Fodinicurvata sp. CAU 1616]